MEIKSTSDTGNQAPTEVDISAGGSQTATFVDADAGEVIVVVDTSAANAFEGDPQPSDPGDFSAEMEYTAENSDSRFQFSDGGDPSNGAFRAEDQYKNYPYYEVGKSTQKAVQFDISQPNVEFSNINREGKIEVTQTEAATVRGESNVAPGSDASLYLRTKGSEDFFVTDEGVGIGTQSGEFETAVDFTNQPIDQEFIIEYRINDQTIDTAEGVVVNDLSDDLEDIEEFNQTEDQLEGENQTETANESTREQQNDDEDNDGESVDQPSNGGDTNTTNEKPAAVKVPGFTPIHAVLSLLLGAILIATRTE
jgi:hypothetical protein